MVRPLTTTSQAVTSAVGAFEVEVVRLVRLSPTFLRVTFGGPSLQGFLDHGPLGPRDLRVKLVFPVSDREPRPPTDLSDGWYRRWRALDPEIRGVMRTYTVRRCRLGGPTPEIDVDFALHHEGNGGSGPASTWAAAAQPGQRLTLIGPAAGGEGYGGIEWRPPMPRPVSPPRLLLVGDETAVPAICSILETVPQGYEGHAVLEVPHPEDFAQIASSSDIELRWLARHQRPRGELLDEAVRALLADRPALGRRSRDVGTGGPAGAPVWQTPAASAAGATYGWVAGEAGLVRTVRRHLVDELGRARASVAFMGYWRRGSAEGV